MNGKTLLQEFLAMDPAERRAWVNERAERDREFARDHPGVVLVTRRERREAAGASRHLIEARIQLEATIAGLVEHVRTTTGAERDELRRQLRNARAKLRCVTAFRATTRTDPETGARVTEWRPRGMSRGGRVERLPELSPADILRRITRGRR